MAVSELSSPATMQHQRQHNYYVSTRVSSLVWLHCFWIWVTVRAYWLRAWAVGYLAVFCCCLVLAPTNCFSCLSFFSLFLYYVFYGGLLCSWFLFYVFCLLFGFGTLVTFSFSFFVFRTVIIAFFSFFLVVQLMVVCFVVGICSTFIIGG